MKKMILAMTLAVALAGVQNVRAGEGQWALTGMVLTGVAGAAIISHTVQQTPGYYSTPAYSSMPAMTVVYASAPAPAYIAPPPPMVIYDAYTMPVYRAPVYVPSVPVIGIRIPLGGGRPFRRD